MGDIHDSQMQLQSKPFFPQNDMSGYPKNINDSEGHSNESNSMTNNEEEEMSPAENRFHRTRMNRERATLIIPIVLSVIALVVAVVAIVLYKQAADELRAARENRGMICLPCEEKKIQIESWKKRAGECCVRLEDVLQMMDKSEIHDQSLPHEESVSSPILIHLFSSLNNSIHLDQHSVAIELPIAEKKADERLTRAEEIARAQFSSGDGSIIPRISAHLILANTQPVTGNILWKVGDQGHIEAGLSLDTTPGRVKVLETGYYYLYSQLTFLEDLPASLVSISHQIDMIYEGVETPLLSNNNMKFASSEPRTYSQQTSFVSGVMLLHKGAEVTVVCSNKEEIRFELPKQSYFGLFKI